jgi:hypothetical protein
MLLAPASGRDFILNCGEEGRAQVPRTLLRPIGSSEAPQFTPVLVR